MAKENVDVTLKPPLLDAPGKVVRNALNNVGSGLLGRRVRSDGTQ
jgi:phosphoribosylformylglycinamidine (FGAM) synthase PurS component